MLLSNKLPEKSHEYQTNGTWPMREKDNPYLVTDTFSWKLT